LANENAIAGRLKKSDRFLLGGRSQGGSFTEMTVTPAPRFGFARAWALERHIALELMLLIVFYYAVKIEVTECVE
jgi:hypothetical protein